VSTPIRKRPSIGDVANAIEEIGRPANEVVSSTSNNLQVPEEPYWRKTTIPFRHKQLTAIEDKVKRLQLDQRVRISISETMRLALDRILVDLDKNPDQVLLEIYQMYRDDAANAPGRKVSRKSGLEKYLRRKKLL
jgi:hypothetical protein